MTTKTLLSKCVPLSISPLALLAVLSLSLLFATSPVSAVSIYDDLPLKTSTLKLDRFDYYGTTCDEADRTNNYMAIFNDDNTLFYTGTGSQATVDTQADQDAMQASFSDALDGGSWIINQERQYVSNSADYSTIGYDQKIVIHWQTTDDTWELSTATDGLLGGVEYTYLRANSTEWHSAIITYNNGNLGGGQNCEFMVTYDPVGSSFATPYAFNISKPARQYDNSEMKNFLISNYEWIPPDGYEGSVPDTSQGGDAKPIVQPKVAYQVNNKAVRATDDPYNLPTYEPTEEYYFTGWKTEWFLYHCDNGYNTVTHLCSDGTTIVKSDYLDQGGQFSFDVADYGDYMLQATWSGQECYDYSAHGTTTRNDDDDPTPDYCVTVPIQDTNEFDYEATMIYLKIDGSSYTGYTDDQICDVSGFCHPADLLCADVTDNFFDQASCEIQKKFSVGVLNPSINAFKHIFQSLTVPTDPQCNIPLQNVNIAPGQSFPLSTYSDHACTSAAQFRNAFPLLTILVNFMFALSILYLVIQIINKLTNDRDNDLIQGVAP